MKSILFVSFLTRKGDKFIRFRDSVGDMTDSLADKYSVSTMNQVDTFLPDAQNKAVDLFLDGYYDYLVFLDDDHWGHTREMFECLMKANAYMATIKTYSRHYPYSCALMKRIKNTYAGIENGRGYQECDLTGFPMTLFKRELFDKIKPPYFRSTKEDARPWATDREFCERISKLGIKPVGCFQHCLPHDDITEENVLQRRFEDRRVDNNLAMYLLFNKRQKILQGA